MDARDVALRLGLGPEFQPWLASLQAQGPPPDGVPLPSPRRAGPLLARLGVPPTDIRTLTEIWPRRRSRRRRPERWWLLERAYERVRRDVGDWDAALAPFPTLPPALGPWSRAFWVFVFVAAVGDLVRWHERRAIPADVSWATLADLGQHVALYRRRNGTTGLDTQFWLTAHFTGSLYALGRLQFNGHRLCRGPAGPPQWYDAATVEQLGPGFGPGDAAVGVHIPAAGPLTPEACDESLVRARAFFRNHFPAHEARVATCTSWLLDDQLAEYLPATSNIIRFQRRFEIVPGAPEDDREILRFVFDRVSVPASPDDLPQRSGLERAVVAHLRAGRHWRVPTGWVEL